MCNDMICQSTATKQQFSRTVSHPRGEPEYSPMMVMAMMVSDEDSLGCEHTRGTT